MPFFLSEPQHGHAFRHRNSTEITSHLFRWGSRYVALPWDKESLELRMTVEPAELIGLAGFGSAKNWVQATIMESHSGD